MNMNVNFYAPNFEKLKGILLWACLCIRLCISPFKIYNMVSKFHRWTKHEKITDLYFFLNLDYLPLWSYAPFKGHNKIIKLHLSPISLHSASSVRIPSSYNTFWDMLPTIRLSPLGSPIIRIILNHLMHSKDVECILMFLSAMPRGVSVAHNYVLKLPLHHL